jgi:hypothetical protein
MALLTIRPPRRAPLPLYRELAPGRCSSCGGALLIRTAPAPNHRLHLIVTLATLGLWIPMWGAACLWAHWAPWECLECGQMATPTAVTASRSFSSLCWIDE